ncbi:hypothetical protein MMC17_010062 [Xylographa soralifera]|nr:hypothetical protein [Xylographa soralifera]
MSAVSVASKASTIKKWKPSFQNTNTDSNSGEDGNVLGLHTVYQPIDSEPVIDLQGESFDTWRSEGGLWPRDFLSHDVTHARVLIYSYSPLLRVQNMPLTVQALGGLLLGEVSKSRKDEISATRPLIFVAHSLGGLVVKSALAYSQALKSVDKTSFLVSEATMGCCFFGTPHHGIGNGQWMASISQLTPALGAKGQRSLHNLESLYRSMTDDEMAQLSIVFCKMTSQLHIAVLSFFEQVQTPTENGTLTVISEAAALIGLSQETRYGLQANHRDITKFRDSRNSGYLILIRFIKVQIKRKGIRSVSVPISTVDFEQEVQRSTRHSTDLKDGTLKENAMLSPMEQERSFLSQLKDGWEEEIYVSTHCPGTCRWVLETPTFRDFISGAKHNRNMLCILGGPGSGKSVIAKFLVYELSQKKLSTNIDDLEQSNQDYSSTNGRQRVQKDLPVVLKYFFNFRSPAKSDSLAFVKAIFYQLLSQDAQLFVYLRGQTLFKRFQNQFSALEQELIALLSIPTVPFKFVVVDALDECRIDDFPAIQKLLTQLASISSLRVIVTSRPSLVARSAIMFTYCLDLDLSGNYLKLDVLKYVIYGVKQIVSRKSIPQDLIDEIISSVALRSADNFLAAKLVLQELDSYQPVRSVREVIQAIPEDLSSLYSSTLERMDPLIRTQMIGVLYFVMNAKTALNLPKLSALMALSRCERPSHVHKVGKEVQKHESKASSMNDIWGNAPAQLERDIQEFCSTLLTINGAEVILLHTSVRGFLEQEKQVNVFLDTFREGSQDFVPIRTGQNSLREVHSLMAVLCLQYIFAAYHEKDTGEDSFDFTGYACSFWTDHLREAGEAVPSHVGDLVKKLLCSETNYFSFWEARIGGSELLSLGTRSYSSRMAIVITAFDLWELLGDRLGLSHYDTLEDQNNPGRIPLHIAAAFNAISSIKYIWNHSTRGKDLSTLINDVKHPLSQCNQ